MSNFNSPIPVTNTEAAAIRSTASAIATGDNMLEIIGFDGTCSSHPVSVTLKVNDTAIYELETTAGLTAGKTFRSGDAPVSGSNQRVAVDTISLAGAGVVKANLLYRVLK